MNGRSWNWDKNYFGSLREDLMPDADVGFILLDSSCRPLAANRVAVRVLAFPTDPARMQRVDTFLHDKLRTGLVLRAGTDPSFVSEFRSGKRRYNCSAFRLEGRLKSQGELYVLLLQRPEWHVADLSRFSTQYDLTPRERQAVEFLVQGLTTKEIAGRMKVSPSTISAFLRFVMVKMGTNSRSGIVGKVVHPST